MPARLLINEGTLKFCFIHEMLLSIQCLISVQTLKGRREAQYHFRRKIMLRLAQRFCEWQVG